VATDSDVGATAHRSGLEALIVADYDVVVRAVPEEHTGDG